MVQNSCDSTPGHARAAQLLVADVSPLVGTDADPSEYLSPERPARLPTPETTLLGGFIRHGSSPVHVVHAGARDSAVSANDGAGGECWTMSNWRTFTLSSSSRPRFRATSLSSFSAAHSEPVSYLPDTLQRMAALQESPRGASSRICPRGARASDNL